MIVIIFYIIGNNNIIEWGDNIMFIVCLIRIGK